MKVDMGHVCQGIGMIKVEPAANLNEIKEAQQLLEQVLCGLAYSSFTRNEFDQMLLLYTPCSMPGAFVYFMQIFLVHKKL
jgi:hypothetical protein